MIVKPYKKELCVTYSTYSTKDKVILPLTNGKSEKEKNIPTHSYWLNQYPQILNDSQGVLNSFGSWADF